MLILNFFAFQSARYEVIKDAWRVLDDKGVPIFLEKRKIYKEENEITVVVDRKPSKAGIDPLNKLIDRRPKDNAITVEKV